MKIIQIRINNYRAFYGTHTINLAENGKNLLIYGENGSGKSSLYKALKTILKNDSSIERNMFSAESEPVSISLEVREPVNEKVRSINYPSAIGIRVIPKR